MTLPNPQPQYYFPNEPFEVKYDSHDAVWENKLFGNLLHNNNFYCASFE
jgi:hypothetical protein